MAVALESQPLPVVVKQIISSDKDTNIQVHENLIAAETFLSNSQLDLSDPDNIVAATQLRDWTIQVISSAEAFAKEAPYAAGIVISIFCLCVTLSEKPQVSKPDISPAEIIKLCSSKAIGLQTLSHLQDLQVPNPDRSTSLVACLATFTNLSDPWTNDSSFNLAQSLLSNHLNRIKTGSDDINTLITNLLLNHIKPLFLKSKSSLLTSQGRAAISPLPGTTIPSDFESGSKPWKFTSPHIITVFQWVLTQLDAAMAEKNWPLIIPPLLTILDDVSIPLRIKGCELLQILLKVVPASLLERSGLGSLFHDTLMPYLLFLPSLTPEEESIPLLNASYNTLLLLTLSRYPTPSPSHAQQHNTSKRTKILDEIIRYGILKGYTHSGENVRIAELLMHKSADLVHAMGIHSVKHLKDLLPIISGILTAPFAAAYPPLLDAALELVKAIIVNGWPRLAFRRAEVLEGLLVCWSRIQEEGREREGALEDVQRKIEDVLRVVVRVLGDGEDVKGELQMLRECDSRLEGLLKG
ncbi:MAG: hypothetical protein Q9169_004173 [Polycauliona sp. 2 TL-2023]